MQTLSHIIIYCIAILSLCTGEAAAQRKMIRIYVSTPDVEHNEFNAIGNVMAESVIREFKRAGGMEIMERGTAERNLAGQGFKDRIDTREQALEAGRILEADIVVFSTLRKSYDKFLYTLAFLEVKRDVIQRTLKGDFRVSSSPAEIGREMKEQAETLFKYVPLPSELDNFGAIISEKTVDYENLPPSSEIEDMPRVGRYGFMEQIMTYYRTFPGENELDMLQQQQFIMRLQTREDLDQELTSTLNKFYIYGDFAIRHGLQAYLIKDCSSRAINVLLANKIPVFYTDGILTGYEGLSPDGFCMYKTIEGQYVETLDLTHRKRMAVMFIVPKPGKRNGISRSYLERAVGYYRDEWSKVPKLVEVKDSMFDIIASGLE